MTDDEWDALLGRVRQEVERIQAGSGYGGVAIEVAAQTIRLMSQQSLDFRRDIMARGCRLEERIPEAVRS